jgi:hypothetical protein
LTNCNDFGAGIRGVLSERSPQTAVGNREQVPRITFVEPIFS